MREPGTERILTEGKESSDLYQLPLTLNKSLSEVLFGERVACDLWNTRLGYLHGRAVNVLISKSLISSACNFSNVCEPCLFEKLHVYASQTKLFYLWYAPTIGVFRHLGSSFDGFSGMVRIGST